MASSFLRTILCMYILFILVLKKVHTPLTYELTGSESSSVFFCIHNKSTQLAKKKKRKKKNLKSGWKLDTAAFSALSVDPREHKGLRCIQNKEMGRQRISKGKGRGRTLAHPQGRSQSLACDLSLKGGNLGEGERNMSEQSEKQRGRRNKGSTEAKSLFAFT